MNGVPVVQVDEVVVLKTSVGENFIQPNDVSTLESHPLHLPWPNVNVTAMDDPPLQSLCVKFYTSSSPDHIHTVRSLLRDSRGKGQNRGNSIASHARLESNHLMMMLLFWMNQF